MKKRYLYVNRRKVARDFRLKDVLAALGPRLGVDADNDLAVRFGVPVSDIAGRRHELGIPPARSIHWINWTPELDKLLGTQSDTSLAKQLGVSQSAVTRRRHRIGTPAWKPDQEK